MKDNPQCLRKDCFSNECGKCRILIANYKQPCPFFKTREQIAEEKKKTKARLEKCGIKCRYDSYDNWLKNKGVIYYTCDKSNRAKHSFHNSHSLRESIVSAVLFRILQKESKWNNTHNDFTIAMLGTDAERLTYKSGCWLTEDYVKNAKSIKVISFIIRCT